MFREMARRKQQLSQEECISILKSTLRGTLAVQGEDGYPYALPMNHWYCEETGTIIFHSGMKGHKVDALSACDKVSFCVLDEGERPEGEWAYYFRSVIVFGRIHPMEDSARAMEAARQLSLRFTDDIDYIERELRLSGPHTLMLELSPEHITGKRVHEA